LGYLVAHELCNANIESDLIMEKKLYAQELLRWSIIEWGLEHKCKYYDLSGVKINARSTEKEGIFRNKQKWGGTLYYYWVYSG
jgi:lipid II:glycine glycyltransferase (peptidoglycan interpeptide bridge formation enzyme)